MGQYLICLIGCHSDTPWVNIAWEKDFWLVLQSGALSIITLQFFDRENKMASSVAATFSRGILNIPYLGSFLGIESVSKKSRYLPIFNPARQNEIVIGWGLKRNTLSARSYAKSTNSRYLTLEDGFLRSIGLGVDGSPPLSLVVDDLGVYYDATQPSRLETILNSELDDLPDIPPFSALRRYVDKAGDPLDDEELISRARTCIRKIVSNQLSKYNSSPDVSLEPTERPRVLVVDQTAGDLSIEYGLASPESFTRMLDAALAEHPKAEILVKIHPDVLAGKKKGHLADTGKRRRVRLLSENCNPVTLLQQVEHVYVVTSQLGFEALMVGKPITCFGAPYYAGWGLTDDRVAVPRRLRKRTIEQLFTAAYLLYARYRDPDSGRPCEIESVIDHLALQRRCFAKNDGTIFCIGFTPWKRGYVRRYLSSPWNEVHLVSSVRQIGRRLCGGHPSILVWGTRDNEEIRAFAEGHNIPIWRMEDGFLRSVGLGTDLTAPASLVIDKRGIYFDPNQPSDLEEILMNQVFSEEQLIRARLMRRLLVESGISKYNVGEAIPLIHTAKPGQRIVLVPGQVEGDASIRLGCQDIRTDRALLEAVRDKAPDAYIIYKPHPDVLSGNRKDQEMIRQDPSFDQIVEDIGISQCLAVVDEIHTMTSLVGFEGLLRGKRVTTYGLPFYAGWGLTRDMLNIHRRNRVLKLDELITGCLILYPSYLNRETGAFSTPESVIGVLAAQSSDETGVTRIGSSAGGRTARKMMNFFRGLMYE